VARTGDADGEVVVVKFDEAVRAGVAGFGVSARASADAVGDDSRMDVDSRAGESDANDARDAEDAISSPEVARVSDALEADADELSAPSEAVVFGLAYAKLITGASEACMSGDLRAMASSNRWGFMRSSCLQCSQA